MKIQSWILALVATSVFTACGTQDDPPRQVSTPSNSKSTGTENRDSQALPGNIQFTVDGEAKSFELIAAEHSHYSPLASKIHALSSTDSQEIATILFMYVDLKQLDYPVELPLPRDMVDPANPMMSAMTVGFGYTDEEGNEWAGPGRVRLDSILADGTISGSFTDVSLPHTEKELPNIMLQDGRFTARLWSP